jgi:predicted transcriptional regulator of viral defense system
MALRTGLPEPLARAENRILRPRDFAAAYSNPRANFIRLAERGLLVRVAHGYYAIVPEEQRGQRWKPPIEAVALGLAVADYGRDDAALMGIAAARILGGVPRALNAAVVAVPRQRPILETEFGRVQFVKRAIRTLRLQRVETALVTGYTTTAEQTVLDLAARPTLGGITEATEREAVRILWPRCDPRVVEDLAHRQLKDQAWGQIQAIVEAPR